MRRRARKTLLGRSRICAVVLAKINEPNNVQNTIGDQVEVDSAMDAEERRSALNLLLLLEVASKL